jgi:hypothetical protein
VAQAHIELTRTLLEKKASEKREADALETLASKITELDAWKAKLDRVKRARVADNAEHEAYLEKRNRARATQSQKLRRRNEALAKFDLQRDSVDLDHVMKVKDKGCISGSNYRGLSYAIQDMPREHNVKQHEKDKDASLVN